MNPLAVFAVVFAVLTAIRTALSRGLFNIHPRHVVEDEHDALVRAKAALVCVVHMQTLLEAVDKEIARRQQAGRSPGKATP